MIKFLEYPSIEQFRNVIKDFSLVEIVGLDENGNKIYDCTKSKPIVTFRGTVKLHGTNSCVAYHNGEISIQSRTQNITPEKDNAGFASFVMQRKEAFLNIFQQILSNHPTDKTIYMYAEFAGGNIQKGVAVSNIPKSFFIFDICIANANEDEVTREWIDITPYRDVENSIYNIMDYPNWTMDIDFNNPVLKQNDLIALTIKVEDECPVGKSFGFSGVGEGIVWSAIHNNKRYIFKVKGEKHSVSKVKVLASVDIEKLNGINEFVDYAVTENRLDQAIQNTCKNDVLDIQQMGHIVRWMINDIKKEETDTLESNGLTEKDVVKGIADKVRKMVNVRMNQESGLV
jgi:hypothetical protein